MHPFVVEEAVALTGMGLWGAEVDLAQDSWLSACRPALVLALTLQLQHWCLSLSLSQPLLPGAERQVQALLSRYGPGKLYQVTSNISGAGTLDLTLPRGHIVALLQNKDTKGNSSRLHQSCLENPIDRGTWWATIHEVPKESDTT